MTKTAKFETITPFIANKMLEQNTANRAINESNLAYIKGQILRGQYTLTGEAIKFSEAGTLLDGQHRLLAVIQTGRPIESLVVRGLPEESFAYMDTGKVRAAGDVLSIDGVNNANNVAAMVKFIMNYKNGGLSAASHQSTSHGRRISNHDVLEFVKKHKTSVAQSYPFGYNKDNKLFSGGRLAGLHYLLKQNDPVKADEFCSRLCDGTNLKSGNPVYILRQRLIADQKNRMHMNPSQKLALIIKAWNFFKAGKTIQQLSWNSALEEYPKIA